MTREGGCATGSCAATVCGVVWFGGASVWGSTGTGGGVGSYSDGPSFFWVSKRRLTSHFWMLVFSTFGSIHLMFVPKNIIINHNNIQVDVSTFGSICAISFIT